MSVATAFWIGFFIGALSITAVYGIALKMAQKGLL